MEKVEAFLGSTLQRMYRPQEQCNMSAADRQYTTR
jgi:hypothetical protein